MPTVQNCFLNGAAWTATYGSCLAPAGRRRRIVWLAERPARKGGSCALGCVFCASHECRSAGDRRRGPSSRRRGLFGEFSVRYRSLQAEHIRVHEHSLGHKFVEDEVESTGASAPRPTRWRLSDGVTEL